VSEQTEQGAPQINVGHVPRREPAPAQPSSALAPGAASRGPSTSAPTAAQFLAALGATPVPTRDVFAQAKRSIDMHLHQIEELLDTPHQQARLGAVSIMDFQARRRSTPPDRRQELYELYLRRHDRIDDWSLVDRAAPWVVGSYLMDRPRDPLYQLASSPHWYERRTAITATWAFIRVGQLDDTFAVAELLVHDPEHFVQTAVGGWVREAGKRDRDRLRGFLDAYAATMPRTTLRFAAEKLDPAERQRYRNRP
jgi:3-methyladenine DNA glycosylase AlkD